MTPPPAVVEALADLFMDLRLDGPAAEGWTYQDTARHYARIILDRWLAGIRTTAHPAGGEGLDVVRLSQAFLRVNTFMDGIAASQAAGEIAAAYADLDPGRLASDSEPASESPGADSIATGKDD